MADQTTRQIEAQVQPSSIDLEARTVDLIAYTGAEVMRYDWWEGKRYRLALDVDSMVLDKLNNGAAFLRDHSASTREQEGVIENAWKEDGQLRVTVRFSKKPSAEELFQDVADRIVRKFSIGVEMPRLVTEEREGELDLVTAFESIPYEVSAVPIPADHGTDTLTGDPRRIKPPRAGASEESTMSKPAESVAPVSTPATGATDAELAAAKAAAKAEGAAEERARLDAFNSAASKLGLSLTDAKVGELRNSGRPAADLSLELIDLAATRQDAAPTVNGQVPANVVVGMEQFDHLREGLHSALFHKASGGRAALTDSGRQFAGRRTAGMFRQFMLAAGGPSGIRDLSDVDIIKLGLGNDQALHGRVFGSFSMSTTSLPSILADAMNKRLRMAAREVATPWRSFCRRGDNRDLRAKHIAQFSTGPDLLPVGEGAPYQVGTFTDGAETMTIGKFGRIACYTEEAAINDDLRAFSRIPAALVAAAFRMQRNIVIGLVTSNPNMADGNPVYDAARNNIIAGGSGNPPNSPANLDALRVIMAQQLGLGGHPIEAPMDIIFVPKALELVAQQVTSALVGASSTAENRVPLTTGIQVIADPLLDAASTAVWYGFTDPNMHPEADTIEYGFLEGAEEIQTSTRVGFERDGIDMKVKSYFGAAWADYRYTARNAGA